MFDQVWKTLQDEIATIKANAKEQLVKSERSETTSGVSGYTLATAPLAANGAKGGDMVWISNARKTGEGAGLGTGLVAYYNPATNSYYRFADDTAVVI